MFRVISIALLLLGAGVFPSFAAAENPARIELAENWKLASATEAQSDDAAISVAGYKDARWHPIHRMPATVLEILQEDGVYPNLYVGKNLLEKVPQDLYKQDWWYRTTFKAPAGESYTLEFPGINYRAEIWLNGQKIADNKQVVGMYAAHEFNVTPWIKRGSRNVLAVKVTPERLIQDVDGVELADSWFDWINWKYIGYKGKKRNSGAGVSFVPDRNAGVWKPVYLRVTGAVSVNHALVNSDLSLAESTARLTVFASLRNLSTQPVSGTLKGTISRPGKPAIHFEQSVTNLSAGEEREVAFTPEKFPELVVTNPDLWWPYTMGTPALYDLQLEFVRNETLSDSSHIRFRHPQNHAASRQRRAFPRHRQGRQFLLAGERARFSRARRRLHSRPSLSLRSGARSGHPALCEGPRHQFSPLGIEDLQRAHCRACRRGGHSAHVRLDVLQSVGKVEPVERGRPSRRAGEPAFANPDAASARVGVRLGKRERRPAAGNHSPGIPSGCFRTALAKRRRWIPSLLSREVANGERVWDGIRMEGPYCWRPPNYWFSGKYPATFGSTVEQGDNEHIPTLESLKKFIPADKLWPINDTWFMHAGAWGGNSTLSNIRLALNHRYGPSTNVEDFVRKAQLAHYENTRAQFENFAASGWATHKMVGYWMLNSHWPSFYGNLIDYYLSPGGAYYGAKKGCVRCRWFSITTRPATTARPGSSFQSNSRRRSRPARSRAHLRSGWQGARRPFHKRHRGSFQRRDAGHDAAPVSRKLAGFLRALPVV